MSVNRWTVRLLGNLMLVCFLSGCSGEPKLVHVKALVKLDGKPIDFCAVCFYWTDPTADRSKAGYGRGVTEADGTAIIKDMLGRDGMFPGKYKVTLEKYVAADGKPISMNSKPNEVYGGSRNMMPRKYHNPDTTDLIVEVPASGLDTVFDLKSN